MYAYELKEVFDIDPSKVVSRVFNSFLPGWHSPLLLQPDMYGPVLAVLALPQVNPFFIFLLYYAILYFINFLTRFYTSRC